MKGAVVYCESETHIALAEELIRRDLLDVALVVSTLGHPRLEQIGVPIFLLALNEQASPFQVWTSIQEQVLQHLKDRTLVLFQDQSWLAQAISAQARNGGCARVLIQDGFLEFDQKRAFGLKRLLWPLFSHLDYLHLRRPRPRVRELVVKRLYNNHYFGISRPDQVFVFGDVMRRRLIQQFAIPSDRIVASGPLLKPNAPKSEWKGLKAKNSPRLLFIDQCFLRYQRMSAENWTNRYLPLIAELSRFDLTVKLHPSQLEHQIQDLRKIAPKASFAGQHRLEEGKRIHADIAVTVSSTSFLSCLAEGMPVIFCDVGAIDLMPRFVHPLIAHCKGSAEVLEVISNVQKSGRFVANEDGELLEDYIRFDNGCGFQKLREF